jgi:branched-subunit amino acid transport protein
LNYLTASVIVMAVVTYIPRALPIVAFRGKIKSKYVKSFLHYIPYAVLGAMTFPSILFSTASVYSALAGFIAAMIMSYFEKSLLKVAIGAVTVVYLVEQLIF